MLLALIFLACCACADRCCEKFIPVALYLVIVTFLFTITARDHVAYQSQYEGQQV